MKPCSNCGQMHRWTKCPKCGTPVVSVAEDTIDQMVARASLPNLADLFRKGKEQGLIGTVFNYGEGASK
jgi:uncharacterized protein with PIN domain